MKLNFDLEEHKPTGGSFTPLPSGEHMFEITEMHQCTSKSKGIEMIKGIFVHGETQITIHYYFCINHEGAAGESGRKNLAQVFYFTDTPIQNPDTDLLIGKKIGAVVKINGKGYNEIRNFIAIEEPLVKADELPF